MTKYGVLSLWWPYEEFDTEDEARRYIRALSICGIHSMLEINETD